MSFYEQKRLIARSAKRRMSIHGRKLKSKEPTTATL
jgi:hypothetical protein